QHIAFFAPRGRSREMDIGVYDIARGTARRLTTDSNNVWVVWSPDSKNLVFSRLTSGILNLARIPADGSGAPELLTTDPHGQIAASWSAMTNTLAFLEAHGGINQIWALPMSGEPKPKAFLQPTFALSYPAFSPVGHWMAYVSAESNGRQEVYVRPYP